MKTSKRIYSRKGFSLLELVVTIAIIGTLVGILLPKISDILRNARVREVQATANTLKAAVTDYITLPGGNGSIPRTEGPGIPCSGAGLSGATDAAKGNGARLDVVLMNTGKLERPLSLKMGNQTYASTGSGNEMTWNQALPAFVMTPDAAPLRNWSAVTRIEARTANPALAPSAAAGANFRLDGLTNLNANYVVAYLVVPGVPARDAYELALSMNGPQLAPVEGAACDSGVVAYPAPVNGVTDLYVYLTSL